MKGLKSLYTVNGSAGRVVSIGFHRITYSHVTLFSFCCPNVFIFNEFQISRGFLLLCASLWQCFPSNPSEKFVLDWKLTNNDHIYPFWAPWRHSGSSFNGVHVLKCVEMKKNPLLAGSHIVSQLRGNANNYCMKWHLVLLMLGENMKSLLATLHWCLHGCILSCVIRLRVLHGFIHLFLCILWKEWTVVLLSENYFLRWLPDTSRTKNY